jgi:transposase-like protein
MNNKPTPETDAKASPHIGFYSCATVPADFARSLEKERDEAREELDNQKALTIHTCHDHCKRPMCVLRRERDEARAEVRRLTQLLSGT